jgi:PAS domain S-box-containing protein
VLEKSSPRSDDAFQKLLLRFSEAAARGTSPPALIHLFCEATRKFFRVDGAYFWRLGSPEELVGAEADGLLADDFSGRTLKASESAVAIEAIRQRKTVYVNRPSPVRYPVAAEFHAKSLMASPLVVSNEIIGAVVFLHASEPNNFNDDLAAKATILAGQLGTLLEASHLKQVLLEEHRGGGIPIDVAQPLHAGPDSSAVTQALADRLRVLLRTRLVCILLRQGTTVGLHAVAAESLELATSARTRFDRKGLRFAADLAARAIAADAPITVSIDPVTHALGDLVPAGMLLAAPIRTSRAEGAILIYPRQEGAFSREEKALLSAVAEFGAVAIANAEIYETARAQADEMHQLGVLDRLDGAGISPENVSSAQALAAQVAVALEAARNLELSEQHRRRAESLKALALELNSHLRLPECARNFAIRAADLMGARSAAFAVQQGPALETLVLQGVPTTDHPQDSLLRRFDHALVEALAQHPPDTVCASASELFGSELSSLLGWEDCNLIRLRGSSGDLVGVLCLANRGKRLQDEDEDLLQAIAAQASVALENARLFTRMDQANRHWIEIFDAITDFIVAHDQSDHVLRVNRSLADFIGIQPHELIGVKMGALLATGDNRPLHACPFCRSTDDVSTDEYVLPVLDRTYLVSTSRVHGANSEGLQTIHVLKDITDRREAERRYRELFDNIQEGVFFSTPDGRFIEVNDALVRMLGYRNREQLLQADVRTQVCFSADQYEDLAGQMQQHGAVRNHEQTLCRQDGSPVHVLINAFAVRDAQQRIVQYRGVMLDISGLKTFQSELQRERDFSGKILNNTQSLILVADTSGLVSYANRRWYDMGYQQNQLLSRPLEELIVPARRQALNEAFASTLAGQQIDNLEVQIVHGEGRVGYFSMNLSPMRDEQGNVASIVVVMSDITDAATLQAKLLHAEKMAAVGQLVSGVAHEVNNPLTAILGFSDLLMENPDVPESARKDLRVILEQAQRTKQIVQNLLSFARQVPPQRRPVKLNTILSRTVQLRAYDLHSRGVEVVEQLDPDLQQAIGDAHQLQQVFLNILNNAYDAVRDTGRPARIEIKTTNLGGVVEVLFRDNGYGISFPERIFDPFFTTKEIGKGTGLGLSICYGIVREHGGEILCHNNEDGEGATFVVRLPAVPESAAASASSGMIPA